MTGKMLWKLTSLLAIVRARLDEVAAAKQLVLCCRPTSLGEPVAAG